MGSSVHAPLLGPRLHGSAANLRQFPSGVRLRRPDYSGAELGKVMRERRAPPPARLHRSGGYTWRLLPPVSKRADQAYALYGQAAK